MSLQLLRTQALLRFARVVSVLMTVCIVTTLGATAAQAQNNSLAAMTCTTAVSKLQNGGTRSDVIRASRVIVRCGDVAPGTIATVFRSSPVGSLRDSIIQLSAWYLSDARLADSVYNMATINHGSLPLGKRQALLRLLTHYVQESAQLLPGGLTDPSQIVIGSLTEESTIPGNVAMTSNNRTRSLTALRAMSYHDPDANIRQLATLAADQLELRLANLP